MDKEKELFQAVYKSVKNTISQTLQSTTETIKENRDIKEGKPIEEIYFIQNRAYQNVDRIVYQGCRDTKYQYI